MGTMIDGIILTPLKVIEVAGGDVLHAMKSTDQGYHSFGEAYFSTINKGAKKGWKRHTEMTLNLVVPVGAVRFVLFDDRDGSPTFGYYNQFILARDDYSRLTVPPMVWMGFQGLYDEYSLLLNIANILHEPAEVDQIDMDKIDFDWSII
jgi:dTDP-4-dehydrorhamnose 3,5-epimerase